MQNCVDRRRHISNLVIHPRWNFFAKLLEAVNFFRKSSILDVWMGSKYAFRGLCTAWFTKGTSHCSCWKSFKNNQQLLGEVITNKLAVSSSTDNLLKNQIFGDIFEEEDYKYAILRKKLLVAPIVEHVNITTLGKSQWYHLSILRTNCLSIAFLPNFFKVKYKVLYERSCSLLLS